MGAFVSVFVLPKHGSSDHECEDAAAVIPTSPYDEWVNGPVSAAVSDGASESMLARDWARRVTTTVVEAVHDDPGLLHRPYGFVDATSRAVAGWADWIAGYAERRADAGRPVQWYERPKLERGAYATVLALHFDGDSRWWAAALGDSCLFQVRDTELLCAFPVERAGDFDTSPRLLNSRGQDRDLLADRISVVSGTAEPSDQFFLCTDALALWFLDRVEAGHRPWDEIMEYTRGGDAEEFAAWIAGQRSTGGMRNDDLTIVHLDMG
jgi:Protein phosphatase 2C